MIGALLSAAFDSWTIDTKSEMFNSYYDHVIHYTDIARNCYAPKVKLWWYEIECV